MPVTSNDPRCISTTHTLSCGGFGKVAFIAICMFLTFGAFFTSKASAHENDTSMAHFSVQDQTLTLRISTDLEHLVAAYPEQSFVPNDDQTDSLLRSEDAQPIETAELLQQVRDLWPRLQSDITILAAGEPLTPELASLYVPPSDPNMDARFGLIVVNADIPQNADTIQIGWPSQLGTLLITQTDSDAPYNGVSQNGALSDVISLGSTSHSWLTTFTNYTWLGFEHIIPKGMDHIVFVLGLFFFSMSLRPLLWQVTGFTIGHSISLAAGILGLVSVPGNLVEPLIAASIVFIGIENIFANENSPWRAWVVGLFGLVHGLGFASVLSDLGMGQGNFFISLFAFNLGVELGQLTVIGLAFAAVGLWFGAKQWYRKVIAIPASLMISALGVFWLLERTTSM